MKNDLQRFQGWTELKDNVKRWSAVICKRLQHGLVICSGCHQKHQLHSHLAITSKLLKDLKEETNNVT